MTSINLASLGRILTLQTALYTAVSQQQLGELICSALIDVPGVNSVAFYVDQQLITHIGTKQWSPQVLKENNASAFCPECLELQLQTANTFLGLLVIDVSEQEVLQPYLPHIENTVNIAALILENKQQAKELTLINKNLEAQVVSRVQALKSKKQQLALAFKVAKCGIWDWDMSGNTVFFDPNYYRIAGYEPNEFPHKFEEWEKRVHPDDLLSTQKALQRYMDKKAETYSAEFRFKTKAGDWMWILTTGQVAGRDENGNPTRFTGLHIDISESKKREKSLRKERTFSAGLIDTAQIIILVLDVEGRIQKINPFMAELTGYTEAEVKGKDWFDTFLPPADHTQTRAMFKKAIDDIHVSVHTNPIVSKDGRELMIEWHNRTLTDDNKTITGIIAIGVDITERIQAAEQLRDSEFKFKLFVDHTHDWESWTDTEGNYIYISPSCERVTGYTQDEFRANSQLLFDMVQPEHIETVKQHFIDKNKQQTPTHSLVFPIVAKAGEDRWIDHHCSPVYDNHGQYVGRRSSNRDVTERIKSEEEVKAAQLFIDRVIDMSPIPMWICDQKGTVIRTNNSLCKTLNTTADNIEGKYNVLKDKNLEIQGVMPAVIDVFKKLKPANFTMLWKPENAGDTNFKDIQDLYIEVSIFPIINTEGKLTNAVCQWSDLTEHKKAEQDRLELEIQLRQKFKMEAVGTMAGGIAHNFNNNLSIILGNVELSQLKANNPEINELLSNAKIAIMRSRDLVSQIMTYSRTGSHAKAPLQLPLIIDETLKLLGATVPSTIQLNQTISPDSYHTMINADASQIQEILLNLYGNAVHAMEEEGELNISLDVVELTGNGFPNLEQHKPGRYTKISIQDNGCGMSAETQEKIFDPFFTTKELYEGTGMGLSTVQGIIDRHDGLIKVISVLGEGTTFELYFPVVEKPQTVEPTPINEDQPKGKEKILFIDDDEMLAQLGELMLSEMGYQVTMMTDSTEALQLFATTDHFDLVITDQTMPGLTGKELIPKLKKIRPDIQTIICTGYSSKVDEAEAQKLGADAFMMKPLDLPVLLQTIRQVLDGDKE